MKKLLFGLLLILGTVFTSCQKDESLWVGSLNGTSWLSVKTIYNSETELYRELTTLLSFNNETFFIEEVATNPDNRYTISGTYVQDNAAVKLIMPSSTTRDATICNGTITIDGTVYIQQ